MVYNRLEDVLIARNVVTADQILQLKREARQQEQGVWYDYAIKQQLFTHVQLAQAYGELYDIPFLASITEKNASPELLIRVPLRFLREYTVMPLYREAGDEAIMIVTDNPSRFQPLDELKAIFGRQISYAVAARAVIIDAINKFYPLEEEKQMIADLVQEETLSSEMDFGEISEEDIVGMASDAPIVKLVNHILYQAVKQSASDIHIEPFEREIHVRYRIDGILHTMMMPPKRALAAMVSRLKIMANLNIAEKRKPQDGRIQLKIANKAIDIRVSVLPVMYGERVVLRLLDKSKTFGMLEELGMSERDFTVLKRSIEQPNGIIFMTGPTGSGKTSTLYAILSRLNAPDINIITVEDPVEYNMEGISQVQVKEKIGLTFAVTLRSILRQDPDVIMIGETRDSETAHIAIQSAMTGHRVLSTLHTNSAASAITRLIDMNIEPFLISSTLIAVIAQRLVRTLCPACKQKVEPSQSQLALLGLNQLQTKDITFYTGKGCDACMQSGYRGRLAIFEIMPVSNAIARLITDKADARTLQYQARQEGMTLLIEDGIRKISAGLTSIDEVLTEATFRDEAE